MNSNETVMKRYAKALFEIAQERKAVVEIEEQLSAIVAAFEQDAELRSFFQHPNIEAGAKAAAIDKALGGKLHEVLKNTLGLLLERGRGDGLDALLSAYRRIANEALGQEDAIVVTAKPLDDQESKQIAERFSKLTGRTIRIQQQVDPTLLGGIQVRIGDRLYDGSLKGKLTALSKSLVTTQAL